jgi:hypothetical protein
MAVVKEDNKIISENNIKEKAFKLNLVPAIHELYKVLERLISLKVIKKVQQKNLHYAFYVEFFRKWIVIENSAEEITMLLRKMNPEIENYSSEWPVISK